MTEPQLIQALQQRQESAFKELVTSYQDQVYHTLLGFLQDAADAEDQSQEVFIRVFQQIGSFKGESSLRTWIYRIAVSQALDHLKMKNRKKRGRQVLGWLGFAADHAQHPAEFEHPGVKAENKEKAGILFRAVQKLPQQQQTAFLLQKLEGLSQLEIATIMETTASAVESLLSRARSNLKTMLTAYYHGKN